MPVSETTVDALMAEILALISEAGISGPPVGFIARRLAGRIEGVLGAPVPNATSDLTEALAEALRLNGVTAEKVMDQIKPAKTRINVTIRGKRTSITIPKPLHEKVSTVIGASKANAWIREFGPRVPENTEQPSSWISNEIARHLQLMESGPASQERH